MTKLTGVVSAWKKTFGFIIVDGSSDQDKELFCHFTQISKNGYRSLQDGDRVSFTIGSNHLGPMAENIEVIEDEI